MKKIPLFGLLLLVGCLSKPEQPPLSEREINFIDSVEEKCRCKVERDVDVMLLERFAKEHKRGGYGFTLLFECEDLKWLNNNRDSAKRKADQLISPLYNVLNRDPKFNVINIAFTCSTDLANSSKYQDMLYEYKTDSLNYHNE